MHCTLPATGTVAAGPQVTAIETIGFVTVMITVAATEVPTLFIAV